MRTRKRRRRSPESAAGLVVLTLLGVSALLGAAAQRLPHGRPAAAAGISAPLAKGEVTGLATFYADAFEGRSMADGRPFDMDDPTITAANAWPLGTRLLIRRAPGSPWDATLSPQERKRFFATTIIVTVHDRGRFTHALDLSRAAFAQLGRPDEGVIRLYIQPIGSIAK